MLVRGPQHSRCVLSYLVGATANAPHQPPHACIYLIYESVWPCISALPQRLHRGTSTIVLPPTFRPLHWVRPYTEHTKIAVRLLLLYINYNPKCHLNRNAAQWIEWNPQLHVVVAVDWENAFWVAG